jgi:hypothetical protein
MVQTLTRAPTLASTLAMIGSDVVELLQPISTTSLQAQHSNPSLKRFMALCCRRAFIVSHTSTPTVGP